MNWLAMLMDALDSVHGEHSDDPCDCYERLADALREGTYRLPEVSHDVPAPPLVGCETYSDYAYRTMQERIIAAFWSSPLLVDLPYDASKAPIGRRFP